MTHHQFGAVVDGVDGDRDVLKTQDTVQAVFLFSLLDAGDIVRAIYEAVDRLGSDEAMSDFKVGLAGGAS